MADALTNLDGSIKSSLQAYLKTPVTERTQEQYGMLVDRLARAALDYSRALVAERVAERRMIQSQIGRQR